MKALKSKITQLITTTVTLAIMGVFTSAYSAPYYAPYPTTTDIKNLDQGSQQIGHAVVLNVTVSGVTGMGFYTWKLICPPGAHDGIKVIDVHYGPGCWILDGNLPNDLGLLNYWPMPTLDASLTLSSNTLSCTWATLSIHGCMAIGTYPVPAHNFFSGYNATTGYLSESRPVWADIDPATTPTSASGYGIAHGAGLDAWAALLAPSTPSIPYHSGVNGAANLTLGSGLNLTAGTLDANIHSFNSRVGAVVPATNDYSFSQISGTITSSQLPTATPTTIGAVFTPPLVTPPHNFIYGYSAGWLEKQPVWSDIDNSTTPTSLASYGVSNGAALDALGALFSPSTPSIPYHSGAGGTANLTLGSGLNLTAGTLDANMKSFNSRTGAVVPAANDYTFAQLASKPTSAAGYGITNGAAVDAFAALFAPSTPSIPYHSGTGGAANLTLGSGLNLTAGTLDANMKSFNSRTGAVVPASGDYTFAQISSTPTTLAGYGITDAEASSTGLSNLAAYLDTGTLPQLFYKSGLSGINTVTVGSSLTFTGGALAVNWASPALTGVPTAPTASTGDNSTQIATDAFVKNQAYAPLASPTLTGSPAAPTQTTSDNSTLIATDAFVKNQAYAPLASPTFTGTVNGAIAAWSGNLSTLGTFGIGTASPDAAFQMAGTYTTNPQIMHNSGILNNSTTGTQYGFLSNPTFGPTGASLSNLVGYYNNPHVGTSAINITSYMTYWSVPQTDSGYSGTIANAYGFYASGPSIAGTNQFTNFTNYYANVSANGNGITTGTDQNYGFRYASATAAAASGGTVINYAAYLPLPTGSGAGTTQNYGLRITGNGGSGGAGSTTNYSIYDDSTASNYIQGSTGIGVSSPAYKLDVSGDINASGGLREAGVLISGKYLPVASPVFTGTMNGNQIDTTGQTTNRFGSSSNTAIASGLESATTQYNLFGVRVNTKDRWAWGANNDTESGSNVGSNFVLNRYADNGAFLDKPFYLDRSTGIAHISNGLEIDVGTVTFFPTRPTDTITQIIGTPGINPGLVIDAYNGTPKYLCRRVDATIGIPSAVQSDDMLCDFGGRGYGATDYSAASRVYMRYFAAENWTDTAQGTYATWGVTPTGTASAVEKMRLTSAALNIGVDVKTNGTIPTLSACGTSPTIRAGSTDTAGEITEGTTAAGCTITFTSAKSNIPFCVVSSQTQLAAFAYVLSTTAITITMTVTTGNKINYQCTQN